MSTKWCCPCAEAFPGSYGKYRLSTVCHWGGGTYTQAQLCQPDFTLSINSNNCQPILFTAMQVKVVMDKAKAKGSTDRCPPFSNNSRPTHSLLLRLLYINSTGLLGDKILEKIISYIKIRKVL